VHRWTTPGPDSWRLAVFTTVMEDGLLALWAMDAATSLVGAIHGTPDQYIPLMV
jgi:hypothetical protein